MKTLHDALDRKFDAFYLNEVSERVRFERCELGYILDSEGPQKGLVFEEGKDYDKRGEREEL